MAGQTTTCTGVDVDGLTVAADGTTVAVPAGASVNGTSGAAITIEIAAIPDSFVARTAAILIGGTVDGSTGAGISVLSGPLGAGFAGTDASVTVAAGGTIIGTTGIVAGASSGSSASADVIVDNAGSITGTNGVALGTTDASRGGYSAVTNRAGGVIGAVAAPVGTLRNDGAIAGASLSALDGSAQANSLAGLMDWTNNGAITSASAAATIAGFSGTLANSGTIANGAQGAAIAGRQMRVVNQGLISSAGSVAISASGSVNLLNSGTITGDVVAATQPYTFDAARIDSAAGFISGNVTLGGGDDIIVARYNSDGTVMTGIGGTLDAGTGTDVLELAPAGNLTVFTAIALPDTLERLRLAPAAGATLTLSDGFVPAGTTELAGTGSVVNEAFISGSGQVFVTPFFVDHGPAAFTNSGVIRSDTGGSSLYAVDLDRVAVTNTGMIEVVGDALVNDFGVLHNTGTITATGTAAYLNFSALNNDGLIASTGATAATLSGFGVTSTNSGRIEGASIGVAVGATLINTGAISANGTAVAIDNNGVLINRAGGVVSGGTFAIASRSIYGMADSYNAAVFNAGTINGDVLLTGPAGSSGMNSFVAEAGGVLNGNLTLGTGDTLVVDLPADAGAGDFGGINGTVTSNDSLLRYRVSGSASAELGSAGPFAAAGFQLTDGASLTLAASSPQDETLVLSGRGVVDLSADIATADRPAIAVRAAIVEPTTDDEAASVAGEGLTIISRGTLSATRTSYYAQEGNVVSLGAGTLINEGTLISSYADASFGNYATAVSGGYGVDHSSQVINNGSIELNGAQAAFRVQTVINNGSIIQTGPVSSRGIVDAAKLINNGTIDVDGVAVTLDLGVAELTNSGLIVSRSEGAIVALGSPVFITNQAGGSINATLGQQAISMGAGTLVNAGAITGDVLMRASNVLEGATYVAAGGTLDGDLTMTSADDRFIVRGSGGTGVTGSIDAGDGVDAFIQSFEQSAAATLGASVPATFEAQGVEALGSATVVTVTAPQAGYASPVSFFGDGTVVNQADIVASDASDDPNRVTLAGRADLIDGAGLSFVNQATIADGAKGTVRSFSNEGTITSAHAATGAVDLYAAQEQPFTFTNTGAINQGEGSYAVLLRSQYAAPLSGIASLTNSGSISGAVGATFSTPFTFVNSGSIIGGAETRGAVDLSSFDDGSATSYTTSITVMNSGVISAAGGPDGALEVSVGGSSETGEYLPTSTIEVVNSGTITTTAAGGSSAYDPDYRAVSAVVLEGALHSSLTNLKGGVIGAPSQGAIAVTVGTESGTFVLDNAGVISGNPATLVDVDGVSLGEFTAPVIGGKLAGALTVVGAVSTIRNSGSISGGIQLAGGDDVMTNTGAITGDVFLGAGDDLFSLDTAASFAGALDGGEGTDTVALTGSGSGSFGGGAGIERLAVGGGTWTLTGVQSYAGGTAVAGGAGLVVSAPGFAGDVVNAGNITFAQATNGRFSGAISGTGSLAKTGAGNLTLGAQSYTGTTSVTAGTLTLAGTLASTTYIVAAGATLTSALSATVATTGTPVTITNAGTIGNTAAGGRAINLAGGNDARTITLINQAGGLITSADDAFRVNFNPTGGTILVENRGVIRTTGGGQAIDFDAAASGAATITINNYAGGELRSFGQDAVRPGQRAVVNNAGLIYADGAPNNSYDGVDWQAKAGTVNNLAGGTISGLRHGITSDVAVTVVNAADASIIGRNGSGVGSDGTGTVVNSGTITGRWDSVAVNGDGDGVDVDGIAMVRNFGTIQGLSAAGVDSGGRPNSAQGVAIGGGTVENAAGATIFGAAQGLLVNRDTNPGGVADGAITVTNAGTISGGTGAGVQFVGEFSDVVTTSGLISGGGGTAVDLGGGNDTLNVTTGARFVGAIDGNTGIDTLALSGSGSGTVANVLNIEQLTVGAGSWTTSGALAFSQSIAVNGGQLIAPAGSTLTAPTIAVARGALFGSSGTVNGNLAVAGFLSPGGTPGTMTVNGNVALAATSTSLLEITATSADKLAVSGSVTIADGAALQLVRVGTVVTAGRSIELLTAGGGITGRYTSVIKPAALTGVIVQQANRVLLLGTFLNDAAFSPQVRGSIDYVNRVIEAGSPSSAFVAALPLLATATGASNPAAFAQITPEAYASASQIAVENGLTLAETARGPAFASWRETPGLFTFGSALGNYRVLRADAQVGSVRARASGYGFLGGIGLGAATWSVGVFGGYLDTRQRLVDLGARTDANGWVAGVHGRFASGPFAVRATVAYDGGDATTRRAVPGGSARGKYDLRGWIGDVSASYTAALSDGWTATPTLSATTVRWTRQAVAETGGSAFALDVVRGHDRATFVHAGVTIGQVPASAGAGLRPYLTLGARYQIEGRRPVALAGLDGYTPGLLAAGAPRARLLATATLGADAALTQRLSLFGALSGEAGNADTFGTGRIGLKLSF